MFLTMQTVQARLLTGIESFPQARDEAVVEMRQEMRALFDPITGEDLVTFTETHRQHVVLERHEARRWLQRERSAPNPCISSWREKVVCQRNMSMDAKRQSPREQAAFGFFQMP
jgi:hypothetical protein